VGGWLSKAGDYLVARGFIPAGLRSSPESWQLGVSAKIELNVLGLLRNPTGINPLATGPDFHPSPRLAL